MALKNEGLFRTYIAGAAVNGKRFVKFDSDDRTVIQGAAAGDSLIGVSDITAATGERVDVQHTNLAPVEYGGNVTRGALLISDSVGRAIAATAAAGTNVRTMGIAMESGVSGDIGSVLIAPGSFQG